MPTLKLDLDSPWKDMLHLYFQDFMAFFFPAAHDDIDWNREHEFIDKEFQQVVREAELGRRQVDKLAKVHRKGGEEARVLAHIEVQGEERSDFPARIYTYNYRIFDRHKCPVASLVVLADESGEWRPDRYGYELWGFRLGVEFPSVKLMDYANRWEWLEDNRNPFSVVVMAHLKTLATRKDYESRWRWKFRLVKMLYERSYSKEDVVELFRFIDWVMFLPEELERGFADAVLEYEEGMNMPYVTSVERRGIEKGYARGQAEGREEGRTEGRTEGRVEASRKAVMNVLEARFGSPIPSMIIERLDTIKDLLILEELARKAVTVVSPHEFGRILEEGIVSPGAGT